MPSPPADIKYRDEFDLGELKRWYEEEECGYFDLCSTQSSVVQDDGLRDENNGCRVLNWWYGYRFPEATTFDHCVGLGAADGTDIITLAPLVKQFTVVEPAEKFWRDNIGGKHSTYVKPQVSGLLPISTGSVDLVTSLGVLHHIANVSFVIQEIGRVLRPNGLFVFREPIHSMGDWRKPRHGLTRNERGIPPHIIHSRLASAGLQPIRWKYCMFGPISRLQDLGLLRDAWNKRWLMPFDELLSQVFSWNLVYHRKSFKEKVAPHCLFAIARRVS